MTPFSNVDDREAKLLATMLNVLVAGMSDPNRLSRGRTYARQGAVEDLDVQPGVLTGSVQGSRAQPYRVTVRASPAQSFDSMTAMVPDREDVDFSCTCPDWDDPCKHAVAVMVAFAACVADDPEVLGLWRGRTKQGANRAVIGSRTGVPSPTERSPQEPTALDDDAMAALRAFLGEPTEHEIAEISRLGPPNAAWGELWAEMLTDALSKLTDS